MSDLLFLSWRLQSSTAPNVVRSYEKLLRSFPWSQLSRGATTVRVVAVATGEPAFFEESLEHPVDIEQLLSVVREYAAADVSLIVDGYWDLWQFEKGEWKLMPARVALEAYGPEFESDREDDIRIDLGIDTHYLPQPDLPNHLFMARSNIRSLLHLVHDLDKQFPAATRTLWTESGANFAELLQRSVAGEDEPGDLVQ